MFCFSLFRLGTYLITVQQEIEKIIFSKTQKDYVFITAQKMKFSIKDFSSKYDQIRRFLRIWSHLLEKSIIGNFIFCVLYILR